MRCRRREQVPAVKRPRDRVERVLRVRKLVRSLDSRTARRRKQQPVVRPHIEPSVRIAEREWAPWPADARIDDRQMHADGHESDGVREHERSLQDRRRRNSVRDVDDLRVGGDALDDSVARSDEVVLEPEVAQKRDEHAAERNAGSWSRLRAQRLPRGGARARTSAPRLATQPRAARPNADECCRHLNGEGTRDVKRSRHELSFTPGSAATV